MTKNKGDQKHLTLSDRIRIEKGLNNSESFAEIGRAVNKDPTTVSKEVRRHAKVKEYNGYANVPCQANTDKHFPCSMKHICGDQECDYICRMCRKYRCSDVCKEYRPKQANGWKKRHMSATAAGKRSTA